jgi:hypothetical protein
MKISVILEILARARLPSLTANQLRLLVDTAEGKAFAGDLEAFADGDLGRRQNIAAVVGALSPGVRRTVDQLGFQFDLGKIIAAAKRDGCAGLSTIKGADATPASRARTISYLQAAGLHRVSDHEINAIVHADKTEAPYYSFKIFGGAAALCVTEARTRTGDQYTIQIEGALPLCSVGGRREFDWQNKIIVQLTVQEAYLLLALLENLLPNVKFDGHGRAHDKSLHIDCQDSHYFVRMIQRGRAAVAIPVRPVDAIQIVALLYKQLLRNEPHLRIDDIRSLISRMASMAGHGTSGKSKP